MFGQSLGPAGVDRLIGKCGAVDQLFDYYFGTKCGKTSLAPLGPKSAPGATNLTPTSSGGVLPSLPNVKVNVSLPCTVGDLVDSVVGQRSGCDGRRRACASSPVSR